MKDPIFATAHELATAIRERQISASGVLEAHLAQIARHNATLNAIVTLNEEPARKRAREADAALARGEVWGPLHGVPVTIKDSFATAGLRTTSGYPPLADYIPAEDATVVARLKAAGAIVLGKTNLPVLVQGFQSDNPIFGRTNNPWDLTRTPGGSTGGGAAALASGMSPLEIGSDYGGSVRIPAHYCGLFSIKPTERRVPLTGHIPELPGQPRSVRHVATPGPLARSVEDLKIALQLIAGPDLQQPDIPPVSFPFLLRPPLTELRIAWSDSFGGLPITRDTRAAMHGLLARLDEDGCAVEQCTPDGFDFPGLWETYGELRQCEIGSAMTPELEAECAANFGVSPTSEDPEMRGMARRLNATLKQYAETLTTRDAYVATAERFLASWDVFVCPVTVGPAFPHCAPGTPIDVDDQKVPYRLGGTGYTSPFNLTGNPSVVIPLTRSQEGLPIGVQLVGPRWSDMKLLAIAEAIVEFTGPFQRPPGY
ncbi:MAG TPA: amidase [Verrucomicrobiae bacterium]|nr:amidase [Verrucomicrobiae bacterium]